MFKINTHYARYVFLESLNFVNTWISSQFFSLYVRIGFSWVLYTLRCLIPTEMY